MTFFVAYVLMPTQTLTDEGSSWEKIGPIHIGGETAHMYYDKKRDVFGILRRCTKHRSKIYDLDKQDRFEKVAREKGDRFGFYPQVGYVPTHPNGALSLNFDDMEYRGLI